MTKFQLLTAAAAVLAVPAISATTEKFSPQRLSNESRPSRPMRSRAVVPQPAPRPRPSPISPISSAAGLQPGGDLVNGKRSWTQAVPLLKSEFTGRAAGRAQHRHGSDPLTQGEQIAVRAPINGDKGREPGQCAAGLRRLRRQGARAQLGRLQGRRPARQDRRRARQRPRLRDAAKATSAARP